MAANRVIGRNGKVPWYLPEDLQRFRALTLNHTVIVGRKTWEFDLEQRLLPQRTMIVVSRSLSPGDCLSSGVRVVSSLLAALREVTPTQQAFIIGGASIYTQALPLADRLELTLLDHPVDGDTYFPEYEALIPTELQLVHVDLRSGYRFLSYRRNGAVVTAG